MMEGRGLEKTYGTVTPATIRALQGIVGDKGVIFDDAEKLQPYGFDVLALLHQKGRTPEAVVKPQTTEQVSEIMKLATRETIPVTPRGAGSGLAGAAVPTHGGISLSLERMNRILEVDRVDRVAVVEPGVVTNDLCRRVAEEGLMYAGYPMSTETSFIGGNVATNAGGGKVIRYGNTRRHVLGLEVVLADGEVIEVGGRFRKSWRISARKPARPAWPRVPSMSSSRSVRVTRGTSGKSASTMQRGSRVPVPMPTSPATSWCPFRRFRR
jgi:glycolate oxidase